MERKMLWGIKCKNRVKKNQWNRLLDSIDTISKGAQLEKV